MMYSITVVTRQGTAREELYHPFHQQSIKAIDLIQCAKTLIIKYPHVRVMLSTVLAFLPYKISDFGFETFVLNLLSEATHAQNEKTFPLWKCAGDRVKEQ